MLNSSFIIVHATESSSYLRRESDQFRLTGVAVCVISRGVCSGKRRHISGVGADAEGFQ